MNTTTYRLYAGSTAIANNIASLQVGKKGTITGIVLNGHATAAAATDARYHLELSMSSVSTATINDTPGNSLAALSLALPVSNGTGSANVAISGLAVAIDSGDKLYLHLYRTGTAAATAEWDAHIYVSY